jgi:hypothetical protein
MHLQNLHICILGALTQKDCLPHSLDVTNALTLAIIAFGGNSLAKRNH